MSSSFFIESKENQHKINLCRDRVFSEPKMLKSRARDRNFDNPQITYSDFNCKQNMAKMPEIKTHYKPVLSKRICYQSFYNPNESPKCKENQNSSKNLIHLQSKLKELFNPVLSDYYEKLNHLQDSTSTNADNFSSNPSSPLCSSQLKRREQIKKIRIKRNHVIANINSFGNMLPVELNANKNFQCVLKQKESL